MPELTEALLDYIDVYAGLASVDLLAGERDVLDELMATYDEWSDAIDDSEDVHRSVPPFRDAVGDFIGLLEERAIAMERCLDGATDARAVDTCAWWAWEIYFAEIREASDEVLATLPDDL